MTTKELGWHFAKLHGGERKGINDAGIESFHRSERLGRETCQNIQDARRNDNDDPARAEFEYMSVPRERLPGLDALEGVFGACREFMLAPARGDDVAEREAGRDFFDRAAQVLAMDAIPVLRIGDYNTRGVEGSDDDDISPWCRLVRSQGRARSEGVGGGTFGIGQRAPFAFSDLRCVFYSTRLPSGGVRFMGKAILSSFRDPTDGEFRQNVGFFGAMDPDSGCVSSVTDESTIPELFRRTEAGTDIYILGFGQRDWHVQTRRSMLLNFFGAIGHGRLSVVVRDSRVADVVLNASTLEGQFRELEAVGSAKDRRDIVEASFYHRALRDPLNGEPFEREISGLGVCRLYVHRDGKAPQRIAHMRSPRILVFSRGSRRLSGYAAVFLCDTEGGNRLLAALEDPNHASWHEDQASRYKSELKERGSVALREIRRFINDVLAQLVVESDQVKEDFPELAQYLPLDDEGEEDQFMGAVEVTHVAQEVEAAERTGRVQEWQEAVRIQRRATTPIRELDDGGGGAGEEEGVGGGGGGSNAGDGGNSPGDGDVGDGAGGTGGGEEASPYVLGARDVSFRSWAEEGEGWYRVVIHPRRDCSGVLPLKAVGETGRFDLAIAEAHDLETGEALPIDGSDIGGISLTKGERMALRVRLDEGVRVSLTMGA